MKTITLLLGLLLTSALFSQIDSNRTFGLPEMKIKQVEKGKIVDYIFDNTLNKFILTLTVLYPDTNKYNYRVKLADIKRVSFHNGSEFWNVVGVTGAVGFGIGFLVIGAVGSIWQENHHFNFEAGFIGGVIFAVPIAVIGGVFGALSPKYDNYDIHKLTVAQKYDSLRKLFIKYKVKR